MIWSAKQQGIYRTLVNKAWKEHAQAKTIVEKDKVAKNAWYRRALHAELGVWSTKELSQDYFAKACAIFEAMLGDSIYWATRALGGKEAERGRRALFAIRELCAGHDVDEDYARGISRQALNRETLPHLDDLSAEDLITVMQVMKYNVLHKHAEHDAAEPNEAQLAAAGVTGDDSW